LTCNILERQIAIALYFEVGISFRDWNQPH